MVFISFWARVENWFHYIPYNYVFKGRVHNFPIGLTDAPKYDNIWTEIIEVIDSFISEILKYESSVIQSLAEKP